MFANQVRVDPQDNIWTVDQMTGMVIKFNPEGQMVMLLGRKAEAINIPARPAGGGGGEGGGANANARPGAGPNNDVFNRPTDVAWDAQGNIFVADGQGNSRVAKFTKDGVFVKSWGYRGSEPGHFNQVRSIAVAASRFPRVGSNGDHFRPIPTAHDWLPLSTAIRSSQSWP